LHHTSAQGGLMSADFSTDQKRFIEGFASGLETARTARGLKPLNASAGAAEAQAEPTGPDAIHWKAQDRITKAGGKLVDQEKWKRAEHPFDAYARLKAQGESGAFPKPEDNFRWRYHGLFYVAPAQDSYMCRLRIPNGILSHWQWAGMADLADRFGGGYSHITTRANLQIREIKPDNAAALLEGIQDLGLCAKGSGADNIRNVTGSATAGIDPQELVDTRPLARQWHHHILNDRSLYGLPRKFNVAFDGGGLIPTLEETNDIGFQAVLVDGSVRFRLVLGGITGHKDIARTTGVVVEANECTPVADAIIRVFIAHGNRTNRAKARLKYVLDEWGFDVFLKRVEEQLGRTLTRIDESHIAARPAFNRSAHIGVHAQRQTGLFWLGVVLPVGKVTSTQMHGLAAIASQFGDGDIRLTVWQNLLLSGIADKNIAAAQQAILALGLGTEARSVAAGLVACTGATGCKFAAAHTKEDALRIAEHVDARLPIDQPVNIHLTGCHHSCAQHYIGDIGLIGAKVLVNDEGDTVAGYDIVIGGGFADQAKIGRPFMEKVKAEDAPHTIEALLASWLKHRESPHESFQAFTSRHDIEALRTMLALEGMPA
jgi:ferredoxin-nitrite reductase